MKQVFLTESAEETKAIARSLGASLKGGEVLFARGPLGAGKTAFAQGLGEGLGVTGIINSPTFNLIKVYSGTRLTLYHVDCYRLEKADEARKDLGLDEVMGDPGVVTYVEWPEFGNEALLDFRPRILVTIEVVSETQRKVTVEDEE